ncbi:unnamed protein product [Rotaria magnacalcarata]|uniref:Uncharacterized protein n=1 Tax=Rotaria magnacalcarata TaxID=392030 RepID=A0A816YUH7_9BILA|nr:unnamed protein product [Rotaria magnacalcarata]
MYSLSFVLDSYRSARNEGSNAKLILGDTALSKAADTPVQTALKATGKAIESGSGLIAVPALWLKDMQKIGLCT